MKACLIAVACMFLGIGEVSHGQENAPKVWVLEGNGKVVSLPLIEITIDLPGLPVGAKPLTLVRIPAGSFMMGSDDPGWSNPDEIPVHEVTIGSDFFMGKYEVTIAQYTAFLRDTGYVAGVDWFDPDCPILRSGGDYVLRNNAFGSGWNQPMVEVYWFGAVAFANWVQQVAGGTVTLPSESQWEYAARAGTTTRFYFGDSDGCGTACEDCEAGTLPGNRSDYMWFCGNNSPYGTKPVGGKLPNAFGLFDVHGNVWEWVDKLPDAVRVLRGGSWGNRALNCRSSSRFRPNSSTSTNSNAGFRIVREAE